MRQPSCTLTYARCRRPNELMPLGTSTGPNRPSSSGSCRLSVTTSTTPGSAATSSLDPDFGRGESLHDRYYADPKVEPNPSLAPLEEPPYYALRCDPGDLDTICSLGGSYRKQAAVVRDTDQMVRLAPLVLLV